MGNFTNTAYANTINSLVNATKDKIKNPYYKFTDKKPTSVVYYKINKEASTLDVGSKTVYENVGKDSPLKYNRIDNFYLYGIEKIQLSYDNGEFGLEASPIEGDAIILPDTIEPSVGDFFTIPYIKEDICFRITSVTKDTLESGGNIYQVSYTNEYYKIKELEKSVIKTFKFIVDNSGTDFSTILLSRDYELLEKLENLVESLIDYFNELFFDNNVQTFCYHLPDDTVIYDPYLIEFLIRNNVMTYGSKFIYVNHECTLEKTFSLNYAKSFFYALENPSEKIDPQTFASTELIKDPNSLFVTRLISYYKLKYFNHERGTAIEIFDHDVINHIKNNKYYDEKDRKSIFNIWIAYFNTDNDYIKGNILDTIKKFDWEDGKQCFYGLVIDIFIIERYIEYLVKNKIKKEI